MGNPRTDYYLDLSGHAALRPAPFRLPERIYPEIGWFNANRASNRKYHAVEGIEGLVVHATAGGSTVGALSTWKNGRQASAHWIVPDEDEAGHGKEILAVVFESLAAWHVLNSKSHPKLGNRTHTNHWTLGVEIVNRQVPDDKFSDWQVEITAQIVRYCWAKYPNFRYVFSHAFIDPERRSDPGTNFDWDRFVELILTDAADPAPDAIGLKLMADVDNYVAPDGDAAEKYCCE